MRPQEPTGDAVVRTGAAGAGLGLGLMLGVVPAVWAVAPNEAAAGTTKDDLEARAPQGTASGATLAGVGMGFLALGGAAVVGAQRRRWNVSEPIPPA